MSALSWILAFVGFSLLIILHELGHMTVAKLVGMRVEKFSLFFPPIIAGKKIGETEYQIGAIPLGGRVVISGMNPDEELDPEVRDRAYHAQPVWKRIVVILAGPGVNVVLAMVLLVIFFTAVGGATSTGRVGSVDKSYPAYGVLKPGDKLVAVDGKRGSPDRLSDLVNLHRCAGTPTAGCKAKAPAKIVYERAGELRKASLTPIYDAGAKRTRIGFAYRLGDGPRKTLGFGPAVSRSVDQFWFITKATVSLPARLFNAKERGQVSGVVGSYEVTRQTILNNLGDALAILALISLSLAIVNLFPFLPLDGGHIFWAIVEKLRGKPVSLLVMERSGVIGFILVIGLFALGFSNDIGRLRGDGFGVP